MEDIFWSKKSFYASELNCEESSPLSNILFFITYGCCQRCFKEYLSDYLSNLIYHCNTIQLSHKR